MYKIAFGGDLDLFRYKHDIQEVIVWLNDTSFDKLERGILNTCKEYDAVFVITEAEDMHQFLFKLKAIIEKNELLNKVRFAYYFDDETNEMHKFFSEWEGAKWFYMDKVVSLDKMSFFLNRGVSDIYLAAELGFEIENLAPMIHDHDCRIRVCPNYCQRQGDIPSVLGFWIRPEDIDLYGKFIDVFELVPASDKNTSVLHKIYFQDKKWFGNYNEIISDYEGSLSGKTTLPLFGEYRLKCGKKCLKGKRCSMCFTAEELSDTLQNKGIYLSEEA